MRRLLLCLALPCLMLGLALLTPGVAHAEEFRKILLADGRTLVARVDATDDTGLTMGVPQGQVRVPFEQVMSLDPIDVATYQAQPAWVVVVLPVTGDSPTGEAQRVTESVRYVLSRLPAVKVLAPAEVDGLLGAARSGALSACKSDLDCAAPLLAQIGVTGVLNGSMAPAAGANSAVRVELHGVYTATPTARGTGEATYNGSAASNGAALLNAAALSLLVQPTSAALAALPPQLPLAGPVARVEEKPATPVETPRPVEAPKPVEPPKPRDTAALSASRLHALAFVPLPGAPSLARKDWAGFASSWAVAVPCSAALVYGAGSSTVSKPQMIGLSFGSYYASAVLSNLIFGLRQGGPGAPTASVSLAPEGAGASVALTFSAP